MTYNVLESKINRKNKKIQRSYGVKSNKTFVKAMIVTAVIGFTALLAILFIGIKYFVKETTVSSPQTSHSQIEIDNTFYITTTGVIKELTEKSVTYLDIDKREIINYKVKPTTKIQDAYENMMSYEEMEPGDVVEIVYQPQKENLVCIRLAKEAFTKSNMTNLEIDRSNRTITIGNKVYYYNGQTNIMDNMKNPINMHQISDYDVLELKGIKNDIYSIQVVEKESYLQLGQLPIYEGVLEIDRTRQIPLKENLPVIPMTPGEHKVTLQLKGYKPIVTTLTMESGKTLEYNPGDFVRMETILEVKVTNTDSDYQVKVGDKVYNKGENIQVPTGVYTVEISAEGFKTYRQELNLEEGTMVFQVALISLSENGEGTTNTTNNDNSSSATNETTNTNDKIDYKINISSEPIGASIYIDGEYKGSTPFKSTLPVGEHAIILKKEGYRDYETNILIDHSDDQNSYLYTLIPN